jgi:hypothetical protein
MCAACRWAIRSAHDLLPLPAAAAHLATCVQGGGGVASLAGMSFAPPPPDLVKMQTAWDEWERGEQSPGKVLANLKTAGLPTVLAQLIDSGWSPAG